MSAALYKNREPTSGLEPLTCSLRVSCSSTSAIEVLSLSIFAPQLHQHQLDLEGFLGQQGAELDLTLEAYRLCIGSQQGAEAQLKLDGALGMTCPPRSPQIWEVISVIGGMGNSWMDANPTCIARAH